MTAREEQITALVHGKAFAAVLAAVALLGAWMAWERGAMEPFAVNNGLAFASPSMWPSSASGSCFWAVALALGVAWLMVWINERFNLLRDITRLPAALFLLMQAAWPPGFDLLSASQVLAVTVLVGVAMLYSTYNKHRRTRRIFLVFALLSAGSLTQYAFVGYLPIFLMGLGQMRAISGRALTAALLGLVTPPWIGWAFGWIPEFHAPEFVSLAATLGAGLRAQYLGVALFTAAAGLTLMVLNLVKIYSYNSRSRSYNGFVALLLVATVLFGALDYTNLRAYTTLLNAVVAWQATQFLVINRKRRSGYIVVLTLVAAYLGGLAWWMACA